MVLEWTKEVAMATEAADPIERWMAKRRVALVMSLLKGETSVAEAARTHGLTVAEVEYRREKFLLAAQNALQSRPRDEEALKNEQIKKLKQKIAKQRNGVRSCNHTFAMTGHPQVGMVPRDL